eukprot:PhF_6_TR26357/c0_g1_i1/m.37964
MDNDFVPFGRNLFLTLQKSRAANPTSSSGQGAVDTFLFSQKYRSKIFDTEKEFTKDTYATAFAWALYDAVISDASPLGYVQWHRECYPPVLGDEDRPDSMSWQRGCAVLLQCALHGDWEECEAYFEAILRGVSNSVACDLIRSAQELVMQFPGDPNDFVQHGDLLNWQDACAALYEEFEVASRDVPAEERDPFSFVGQLLSLVSGNEETLEQLVNDTPLDHLYWMSGYLLYVNPRTGRLTTQTLFRAARDMRSKFNLPPDEDDAVMDLFDSILECVANSYACGAKDVMNALNLLIPADKCAPTTLWLRAHFADILTDSFNPQTADDVLARDNAIISYVKSLPPEFYVEALDYLSYTPTADPKHTVAVIDSIDVVTHLQLLDEALTAVSVTVASGCVRQKDNRARFHEFLVGHESRWESVIRYGDEIIGDATCRLIERCALSQPFASYVGLMCRAITPSSLDRIQLELERTFSTKGSVAELESLGVARAIFDTAKIGALNPLLQKWFSLSTDVSGLYKAIRNNDSQGITAFAPKVLSSPVIPYSVSNDILDRVDVTLWSEVAFAAAKRK